LNNEILKRGEKVGIEIKKVKYREAVFFSKFVPTTFFSFSILVAQLPPFKKKY